MSLPREFGKKNARALLKSFGMDARHPDYKFFYTLLIGVCEAANKKTRTMRGVGERLIELTSGDMSREAIAAIRRMGEDLAEVDTSPDLNAVRGICAAIKERVKRHRSNKNLVLPPDSVTDSQIRQATRSHPTRAAQARHLGITERHLFRRLKDMQKG